MIYTTRFRLISAFLGVCILVGGLSLLVGGQLLNKSVLNEATTRIRLDLNAAREIYNNVETRLRLALQIAGQEQGCLEAFSLRDVDYIHDRLGVLAREIELDFAGLVDAEGHTVVRLGKFQDNGGAKDTVAASLPTNPAALLCLQGRTTVCGTVILDRQLLTAENPELAERARIELVPTPMAAPRPETEETSGMTITCAVPLYKGNTLIGAIYGGVLLNRSTEIVDRVRETVFQEEIYKDRSIGTATIFFNDLRISTNVMTTAGRRAIGTRVSEEVRSKVLEEGERWTDRAFVVNDWYITAYEPIIDIFGNRVGILYVGVLEAKYVDIRRNTLLVFVLITAAGISIAIVLGYLLSQKVLKPVHQLIDVSRRVSTGDLSPEIGRISASEIGVLQKTFQEMLSSLRERDRSQRAESELKLLQSEKQASVGRLAAGVAHEINNPLTGVLTFTHMLLRREDINDEIRADLQTIADSTERVRRIVKGLLDFSRQTKIEAAPTDINVLIEQTLPLVANQALVKGVIFCFDPGKDIPPRTLDRNQVQSVILNIILNAIDATDKGGHINIYTRLVTTADHGKAIEVEISDTGCGIPTQNLDKLFDPFFTTKEVGRGTGLGLSVSLGIIERHGGTIRVRSTVGEGSVFTIAFPLEAP
ncbi:MAG: cache domain-containing protein [Spirochaetaceae bacterium]|nr:MAG: cache domain-containing protein [Spirochaetaceae bacterium]